MNTENKKEKTLNFKKIVLNYETLLNKSLTKIENEVSFKNEEALKDFLKENQTAEVDHHYKTRVHKLTSYELIK